MKKLLSVSLIALLLIGCDHESTNPPGTPEKPVVEQKDFSLTPLEKQITLQNNSFAFELLKTVYNNEKPDKNILISPLSASLALGMLNNGANGVTHEEMQRVLGYKDVSRETMNGYFQKMIDVMHEIDPDVTFKSANSIWIEKQFPVLDNFVEVNQIYYDSEVRNEDFYDPQTVHRINNWASDKTEGTIPEILSKIPENTVMYVINALYFNGPWTVPFEKRRTIEETFYNQNGQERSIPMMNQITDLNCSENEVFTVAELPYGNESFSMVFILPNEGVSIASTIDELDEETFYQLENSSALLQIPRFKMSYERSFIDDLKAMGMQTMFEENSADFSFIHPTAPLIVSEMSQKTFVEITEEGTEASAVTAIGTAPTSEDPSFKAFFFNRPFLYFIREKNTGAIFFAGVVNNL